MGRTPITEGEFSSEKKNDMTVDVLNCFFSKIFKLEILPD